MPHDAILCHATGERRQHFLNQIKNLLDRIDDKPCEPECDHRRKPLIMYPGYIDKANPRYLLDPVVPPMIVSAPVMEVRPTCEYKSHAHENETNLTYMPVKGIKNPHTSPPWKRPRFASRELKGGVLLLGCECVKSNGLQDQCPRTECGGRHDCLLQPPACLPGTTFDIVPGHTPVPDLTKLSANQPTPCCCAPNPHGKMPSKDDLPQNFRCNQCTK